MQTWSLRMQAIRGKKKIFLFPGKSYLDATMLLHTKTDNTRKYITHAPKMRLHISSLRTGIGTVLERGTPCTHTQGESTFSAVFLNLHFKVTHSPRNYAQGSRRIPRPQKLHHRRQRQLGPSTRPAWRLAGPKARPGRAGRGTEGHRDGPYLAGHLGQAHPRHLRSRRSVRGGPRDPSSLPRRPVGLQVSYLFI